MKQFLVALGIMAATPFAGYASELKTSAVLPASCVHTVLARPEAARCCGSQMYCAQPLSTQVMVRPSTRRRT